MYFCLDIELDTDSQCGRLQVALVIDGTLEQVTDRSVSPSGEVGQGEVLAHLGGELVVSVAHGEVHTPVTGGSGGLLNISV